MIKLIGCIMIIFSTTVLGFNYGERLKRRTKELYEIQRCIFEIENRIVYTHTPLPEALKNTAVKAEEPISTVLEQISYMLKENKVYSVHEAFKNAFSNKIENLSLKDEDINIILDFSKSLGESDIDGQREIFSLVIENIKKQIRISEDVIKKNVKMYRCLGFSMGAVVSILLI